MSSWPFLTLSVDYSRCCSLFSPARSVGSSIYNLVLPGALSRSLSPSAIHIYGCQYLRRKLWLGHLWHRRISLTHMIGAALLLATRHTYRLAMWVPTLISFPDWLAYQVYACSSDVEILISACVRAVDSDNTYIRNTLHGFNRHKMSSSRKFKKSYTSRRTIQCCEELMLL